MANHFGPNVIGHEAHQKALREEKGGANVFGTRVRDAIPDDGPTNREKRQSEFGPAVLEFAHASDTEGNPAESLDLDTLRDVLTENPTFFDSLYESELARNDGARPDALAIFYEVERGIKGAMRADVMAEIRGLLGQKGIDAEARANRAQAQKTVLDEQQARAADNAKLADAPRLKALREREENLKFVEQHGSDSGKGQLVSSDQDAQIGAIAERDGLDLGSATGTGSLVGGTPAKPDGHTQVATQQPGQPILTPKGTSGAGSEGSAADGSSPSDGAASGSTSSEDDDVPDFDVATKAQLTDYLGSEASEVKGTGADDRVTRDDLVKAAKKKARASAKAKE